jgi:hypothetical protein
VNPLINIYYDWKLSKVLMMQTRLCEFESFFFWRFLYNLGNIRKVTSKLQVWKDIA